MSNVAPWMTHTELKMTSHSIETNKYRPDIDGLRALAVLGVIGFHAFPGQVRGGFIGVDLFFVISGYLITTIILESIKNDSFSFANFYARRIKRIFPALILTMVVSAVFGWFALSDEEYKQLGSHIAAGAGFTSNILLWREAGYFDAAAEMKPFLHLWSLGVEEQFYLVGPLMLWMAWRVNLNLFSVILVIAIVSFYLNIQGISQEPVATFYSPQTRFWELLCGGLLAEMKLENSTFKKWGEYWLPASLLAVIKKNVTQKMRSVFSIIGVCVIVISYFIMSKEIKFPGLWAIIPVMGAALIISAGANTWINRTILSNKCLVSLGLISFPLYLIHWPIFAFARIILGSGVNLIFTTLAIFVSVILSQVVYKYIELPVRKKHNATLILSLLCICVGLAGLFIQNNLTLVRTVIPDENAMSFRTTFFNQDGSIPDLDAVNCFNEVNAFPLSVCSRFKNPNIAIIGDSHAHALYGGFAKIKNNKFRPMVVASASCIPAWGVDSARKGCKEFHELELKLIAIDSIEYVVIASYSDQVNSVSHEMRESYMSGYLKTIDKLHSMGKKIIFLIDNPVLVNDPNVCVKKGLWLRDYLNEMPEFCLNPVSGDFKDQSEYNKFVEIMQVNRPSVFYFESSKALCDKECRIFDQGKLLYVEQHHLSIYGSELVVKKLISIID